MRFLDPAFLWGLLAIAVPVALHLLLRRRLPVIEFPLTRLVARAEHVQQPRKRLNRVLLLLTRAALLALLALALARLTLGGSEVQAAGPVAVVVVLDDSMSMQAASATPRRTAFDEARDMADSMLAALPEGSEAALVLLSKARTSSSLKLAPPDSVRRELERARPTFLALQAQPALEAAARLVTTSPLSDRRVVVVSDLARHGFADVALPPATAAAPRLILLTPERASGGNLAVSGLDAAVLPAGSLRATARVSAWGGEGETHDAELEVRTGEIGGDARLAGRAKLAVATGAVGEHRFEIGSPPVGLGSTEVRIASDVLPADDARVAVHLVRRDPRLLVVDGDPQNLSFGSETFYLEKALAPGVGLDLQARLTTISELSAADLQGVSAVLVANAPDVSADRAKALEAAVRGGAGLVVTLGNRVDQRAWNGSLSALLPATLGLVESPPQPASVADGGALDLPRVRVLRWYHLEPLPGAEVLARLSDGSPLVVRGTLGAGRIVVLATSIDRDWTDLPISPWFLPFVHELVGDVMPAGESVILPPVVVGRAADTSQLILSGRESVEGPSGALPADDGAIVPLVPGVHVVRDGDRVRAAFAAVTDPSESDLTRISPGEIAGRLRGAFDVSGIREAGEGWSGGFAAWKALLVALGVLLAAESWLARRAS